MQPVSALYIVCMTTDAHLHYDELKALGEANRALAQALLAVNTRRNRLIVEAHSAGASISALSRTVNVSRTAIQAVLRFNIARNRGLQLEIEGFSNKDSTTVDRLGRVSAWLASGAEDYPC